MTHTDCPSINQCTLFSSVLSECFLFVTFYSTLKLLSAADQAADHGLCASCDDVLACVVVFFTVICLRYKVVLAICERAVYDLMRYMLYAS